MNRILAGATMGALASLAWTSAMSAALPDLRGHLPEQQPLARVDYARDIRPILESHCYACHDARKHKAGLRLDRRADALAGSFAGKTKVIVPGDAKSSPLIARLLSDDDDERMPQAGAALSMREIALVRAWIDQGASWPEESGAGAGATVKHWAYAKPVEPPLPPGPPGPPGPEGLHPIDRFVRARLAEEHMAPAPEADRATLVRRLSLDLTGLSPSIEEIDAFVRDTSRDAYERLVDRLLASPHYGEKQAQAWLDLARYADTNGYEKDARRTMWRYRDWVIEAFDRNLGFDQFTIEQLAGDLLPDATLEQKIATGFHRNTLVNEEGGTDPEEFRWAAVVDRANTTATVWLGTTLACAQCHNHKYDPFTQKEYYELLAFFDNTVDTGGKVDPSIPAPRDEEARALERTRARIADLEKRTQADDPALDAVQLAWEASARAALPPPTDWRVLTPRAVSATSGATLEVLDDGSLLAGGENPDRTVYTASYARAAGRIRVLRLEALTHASLPYQGAGRASNGNFDLTGFEAEIVEHGATEKLSFIAAEADLEQDDGRFRIGGALDDDPASGWAADGQHRREDRTALFVPESPIELGADAQLAITLKFESPYPKHAIGRFRISMCDDAALARDLSPPAMSAWKASGPYASESYKEAIATAFPPEREIVAPGSSATARDDSDPQAAVWKTHEDWLDGRAHALRGERCATYLARTITSPSPMRLVLFLGGDDALRVWWNGEQVHASDAMSGPVVDQARIEVDVRAGENQLALKVVNGMGDYSFFFDAIRPRDERMPAEAAQSLRLQPLARTAAATQALRDHYRRRVSEPGQKLFTDLARERQEEDSLRTRLPTTLVMQERDTPRETHLRIRGGFLSPGELVHPGVPAVMGTLEPDMPRNRLGLARWLVSRDNPLTARVTVNRVWDQLFGRGIVATGDDFGSRGSQPSHPELLDWLALRFMDSGWDVKSLVRTIVTSAAYKQAARAERAALEKDPTNVWLSHAPRLRLEVETLRDMALSASGLLDRTIGGPSTFPPQPDGVWAPVYSDDQWTTATDASRWRRGLYTFWRRSSPYATFMLFDAPSRELACTRRLRTNTPLQALAVLNDPAFVECAGALARRMLREGGPDVRSRARLGFRLCTARTPEERELDVLVKLYDDQRARYSGDREAAAKLAASAPARNGDTAGKADPVDLAAWTCVANALFNLDETLTKN